VLGGGTDLCRRHNPDGDERRCEKAGVGHRHEHYLWSCNAYDSHHAHWMDVQTATFSLPGSGVLLSAYWAMSYRDDRPAPIRLLTRQRKLALSNC